MSLIELIQEHITHFLYNLSEEFDIPIRDIKREWRIFNRKPVKNYKSFNEVRNNEIKIPIRLNKRIGKFVHSPTGFVFVSKEETLVYGRLVNGEVVNLTEEDIQLCKKYFFRIKL